MHRFYGLLLLFLILSSFNTSAAEIVVVSDLSRPLDLQPYLEVLEDPKRRLDLKAIRSGDYELNWQPVSKQFVGRDINSRYWFRFRLQMAETVGEHSEAIPLTSTKVVLYFDSQPIIQQRLYLALPSTDTAATPDLANDTITYLTGVKHPFATRALTAARYGFDFELPQNEVRTVYGSLDNQNSGFLVRLPLKLVSPDYFNKEAKLVDAVVTAFFTILVTMVIYNAWLYFFFKEPVYGWYVLFLLFSLVTCAAIDGSLARYVISNDSFTLSKLAAFAGVCSSAIYLVFVITALPMKINRYLRSFFWLLIMIGVCIAVFIVATENLRNAAIGSMLYLAVCLVAALSYVFLAVKKGVSISRYILVGQIIKVLGILSALAVSKGFLPSSFLASWGVHFSVLVEGVFLSLAVAAKTKSAQSLAENNVQKFQAIYHSATEGFFQYWIASKTISGNDTLARLLGYADHTELPETLNLRNCIASRHHQELSSILRSTGRVQDYEAELSDRYSSNVHWVSLTMTVLKAGRNGPVHIDGTVVDITSSKEREKSERDRLQARHREAISEAKGKAKMQFFASMSHEFRTPLTTILGYTDIASKIVDNPVVTNQHLETIDNSARHMLELVNDVLDISKIESQSLEVKLRQVNLAGLCRAVEGAISVLADKRGLSFKLEYDYPLPETVSTDPTRLRQALLNLCGNAVKFTDEGGVVLKVRSDADAELLIFQVIDTGVGISEQQQAHLFQAFFQAESEENVERGGTGLGLYLSRIIAESLGGKLKVESKQNIGSTFSFSIRTGNLNEVHWVKTDDRLLEPSKVADSDQLADDLEDDMLSRPLKILIAEDNVVNQKLFSVQVSQIHGTSTVVASDGLEAIAALVSGNIDVALMDVNMPRMDGLSAVRFVREYGINTAIYALTGNVDEEDVTVCLEAGCDGHLAKPLNKNELKGMIEKVRMQLMHRTAVDTNLSRSSSDT